MSVGTLFDGVNDNIRSGTGNDLSLSTLTVCALVNWNSVPAGFQAIATIYTAAATPSISLYHLDATTFEISETGPSNAAVTFGPTANTWYFICVTKASGTATPRFHIYNFATAAWSHTNGDTAIGTGSGTITDLRIGSDDTGTGAPFNGDIALVGIGTGNPNDATVETFLDYSTLAAQSWQFFTGTSLINAGTMNDIGSANNDETARTGTAAGRHQLPNGFTNFDSTPAPEFKTIGARTTTGTTSCAIAVPSGIVAGNMLLAGTVGKPSTATVTNPPASGGFSAIANTTGGGGSQGTDTGPSRLATAYKDAAGGEGTLTYTWANSPNSVTGLMARYEKVAANTWATPVAVTADDSSAGTSWSATSGSTLALAPGDTVAAIFGSSTDAVTAYTAAGFSSSGITFSTPVFRANAGGAGTGQDVGQMWTEAQVLSGSGTNTVTVTLTGGPTSSGPVHIIRLRAEAAGPVTVNAQVATLALSGVTVAPTLGALSVTAQTGTVALSGITSGGTLAALTVTAQVAALALAGVSSGATLDALTVTAQVATLALSGVPGTPGAAQPVTVTAQVAALTLTGVTSGATLDPLTVTAQVATLTLTGETSGGTLGALTVDAQTGTLTLEGVTVQPTLGALTVTAQTGTLVLSGVPGFPSEANQPVTVTAQVATLALSGIGGTVTVAALTVTAQTAALSLSGVDGTPTPTATTVTAQVASIALSGQSGTVTVAALTVTAQTATLVLTGVSGQIAGGPVGVAAQTATLALSAVSGVATPATLDVPAQPAALALAAQGGTVTLGALTVTAQVATLVLSAVSSTGDAFTAVAVLHRIISRAPDRIVSEAPDRILSRDNAVIESWV